LKGLLSSFKEASSQKKEIGAGGGGGGRGVNLYRETMKIEKMRGNSSFGQNLQTQNKSSIEKPQNIQFVGILKLIWAKSRR